MRAFRNSGARRTGEQFSTGSATQQHQQPLLSNESFAEMSVISDGSRMVPPSVAPLGASSSLFLDPEQATPRRLTRIEKKWFSELRQYMEERMNADLFAVLAAVIRRRSGRIELGQNELTLWDSMLRMKDRQICGFSMFGLFMSIVTATMFWEFGGSQHATLPEVTRSQLVVLYLTQLCLTISTLVSIVLIVQKYEWLLRNKRMEWSGMTEYDRLQARNTKNEERTEEAFRTSYSFARSKQRWTLAAEVMVHLLHPLIWMNTDATKRMYEAFQIIIFGRLYLLIHIIFKNSRPYRRRREVLAKNPELQATGFHPTALGTMKTVFFDHPYITASTLLLASLALLGFIVFIMERSVEGDGNEFRKLQNSVWFSFVTFSTVGYGDMAPVSFFGRLASIAIGAVGITTTTVFGGVITNTMSQSREQRSVSQYLADQDAKQHLADAAALVVQRSYRYSRIRRKEIVNPWHKGGHKSNVVYGAIKQFREYRWLDYQAKSSTNDPVTDGKVNNVLGRMRESHTTLLQSAVTVKATRHAIRSFTAEMHNLLPQLQQLQQQQQQQQLSRTDGRGASVATPSVAPSSRTQRPAPPPPPLSSTTPALPPTTQEL